MGLGCKWGTRVLLRQRDAPAEGGGGGVGGWGGGGGESHVYLSSTLFIYICCRISIL